VDSAGDGETAWFMFQKKHYDCIIMDWKMPGLSGRELYQLIKDRDHGIADRCVFISGHAANPEVDEFIAHSRNPILIKPFSIEKLRTLVDTLLNADPVRQ
jgi:CheY-like chemotaxis protein